MKLIFSKYQGAGNDFLIIDNRKNNVNLNEKQIAFLCHRRFGVGADGLILLNSSTVADFKMVYYNANGKESTMCGNGGRCIVAFGYRLGIIKSKTTFEAIDGLHQADITNEEIVALEMKNVEQILFESDSCQILNTGSPHFVKWISDDITEYNVLTEGRKIRNSTRFEKEGINVNFAQKKGDTIYVRTYERGVENETLACGTGVTAVAIASVQQAQGVFSIDIQAKGGKLHVSFEKINTQNARKIILKGEAKFVFEGQINLQ